MTTAPAFDPTSSAGEALISGWEPGVGHDDTLVRNYLATLVDRLAMIAGRTSGRVEVTDSTVMVDSNSAYIFDNTVVCLRPLDESEIIDVVKRAVCFFPAGRTWTMFCLTPQLQPLETGLELLGHPPLMYRPAGGAGPHPPYGLEIRPVEDERDLADFEQVLIAAYPLPEGPAVVGTGALCAGFRAWVGYLDGRPVATSGSHTAFGLTEVEWVSTLPSHRGLGIGAAMAWQATASTPGTAAVLVATDDGRPVYQRLGYVSVMRLTMWLRPA